MIRRWTHGGRWLGLMFCVLWSVTAGAGEVPQLEQPARRIISLAPHLTELLFSAGAGDALVGVVAYSDYPPAAQRIPRVGDAFRLDLERVLALKPDLVVAWRSGLKDADRARFTALGIPLYIADSTNLEGIADELLALGRLAGTEAVARQAARRYEEKLRALTARYGGKAAVSTFYQIWDRPLMTVSDRHVIGQVIRRCGGRNPFGALAPLTPTVAVEAVLAADPEVMIAAAGKGDVFAIWRDYEGMRAVRAGHLYTVPGDWISRPSLRILRGMERVCTLIDSVRQARTAGGGGKERLGRP